MMTYFTKKKKKKDYTQPFTSYYRNFKDSKFCFARGH